jgi:hypothetical protein
MHIFVHGWHMRTETAAEREEHVSIHEQIIRWKDAWMDGWHSYSLPFCVANGGGQ